MIAPNSPLPRQSADDPPRTPRIAVVAPSNRLDPGVPARIHRLSERHFGARAPQIMFHPQCFSSAGHFAGTDLERMSALVEVANDPTFDAVWFARGGYGACRIAPDALEKMGAAARRKRWMGYSDAGFLLAGLARAGIGQPMHGPMAADIARDGGETAVLRALTALIDGADWQGPPSYAFNLTVLGALLGTSLEPDFAGRVLMVEEVSEELYRIDRLMFEVTSNPNVRRAAGLALGRCDPVKPNDPPFGVGEEAIAHDWCARSGMRWAGRADIGHDAQNMVVPFAL